MLELKYIPATTGQEGYWLADIGYGNIRFSAEGSDPTSALMELVTKVHERLEG